MKFVLLHLTRYLENKIKTSLIVNFLYSCLVFSMFISFTFFSSCVSAQQNSSQNQENNTSAKKDLKNIKRLQSINSCTIIELPHNVFKQDFNPIGGYVIFGEKPSNLNDFYSFTLNEPAILNDSSNKKTDFSTVKIVGGVVIQIGKAESETYEIEKLYITPQEMRFSTKAVNNIRYEFEGKFLKNGDFIARFNDKDIPVLQGILKKYQSEKIIAEETLKFKFKIWEEIFPVNC